MPTLEDVLVDEIVKDPAGRVPKLALADLLAERGLDAEAGAARWCAEEGLWPYPLTLSGMPGWQWVRQPWPGNHFPQYARARLPEALTDAMDAGVWCSDSWPGALALLAAALGRLGEAVEIDS